MPPVEERPFRLVLFFTRGVSLRAWDEAGLLDREAALYRRLAEQGVEVSFITYGRDDDLAWMRKAYEKAKEGSGRVLLIEGEAGIGKTRLVDEFVGQLRQDGEDINFLFGSYPPGGAATA